MIITYVTITYNAADVLKRTLDSVLRQDYRDIVHLIIDGASTDGTLQIVEDYIRRSNAADNGHRIQVASEPDHGIYDAMNKGLRSLDGDYVCFLNAGDFLPASDTVSRIVSHISDQPAVLYHLEILPPRYARLSSGLLRPYRLCHRHTLRPPLSLLCRCRLVYPHHEGRCQGKHPSSQPPHGCRQLY